MLQSHEKLRTNVLVQRTAQVSSRGAIGAHKLFKAPGALQRPFETTVALGHRLGLNDSGRTRSR